MASILRRGNVSGTDQEPTIIAPDNCTYQARCLRREPRGCMCFHMPDHVVTVDIAIPVEPGVAAALADARTRAAMGRLVSRVLRPRSGPSELAVAIAEAQADARAAGLTDAEIDAELNAYNAERRSPPRP